MWPFRRRMESGEQCVSCPGGVRRYRYSDTLIRLLTPAAERPPAGEPAVPARAQLSAEQRREFTAHLRALADLLHSTQIEYREALNAYNADPCSVALADRVARLRRQDTDVQNLITDLRTALFALRGSPADVRCADLLLASLPARVALLDPTRAVIAGLQRARQTVGDWRTSR